MDPARTTVGAVKAKPHALRTLVVAQALGGVGVTSGVAVGGVLAEQISGNLAAGGLVQTASIVGSGLAAGPLAGLAARRGRRVGLCAGMAIAAVGAALILVAALASALWLLLVGSLAFGAATAAGLQARFAASDQAAPGHQARAMSIVVWATTVGAVLGPNLAEPGAALGERLGIPSPAGPYALSLIVFAAAGLVLAAGLPAGGVAAESDGVRSTAWRVLAEALRDPVTRLGVVAVVAGHSMMVAVMVMTPVHMFHEGMSLTIIGLTISLHVLGMYAASPVFGWLADRFGGVFVVFAGMGLFAGALTAGAFAPSDHAPPVQLMVALTLLGLGWSACLIGGSALVSAGAGSPAQRMRLQGSVDTVMQLGAAGLAALAGPVLSFAGFPGVNLLGGLGLVVLAAFCVRLLTQRPAGTLAPPS